MEGETIGAFVVTGQWRDRKEIIWRLAERGLAAEPWYHWNDTWVFLRADRREEFRRRMRQGVIDKVIVVESAEPSPDSIGAGWHEQATLPASKQRLFSAMTPAPVRFYNTFEPVLEESGAIKAFGAHPLTRLVFRLPKGPHTLRTAVRFNPAALVVPIGQDPTDGVEVDLDLLGPGKSRQPVYRRLVDPMRNPADRGVVPLTVPFVLSRDGDVELVFGAGPHGRDTRDWIYLSGPLTFD